MSIAATYDGADAAELAFRIATRVRARGNEAVNERENDLKLQGAGLSEEVKLKGTQPPLPLHTPQSSLTRPLSGLSQPAQLEPSPPQTPHTSMTLPLERRGVRGRDRVQMKSKHG